MSARISSTDWPQREALNRFQNWDCWRPCELEWRLHIERITTVPIYEYRCRQCGDTFTVSRPMIASSDPASCPEGHTDTTRLLSVAGTVTTLGSGPTPAPTSGGGCCGGGCCGG